MLEWVLSLLIALGVAGAGVSGVTTAQGNVPAGAGEAAELHALHQQQAALAEADLSAASFDELASMIGDKLAAAAAMADSHAQEALAAAAQAAAAGLSTAAEAAGAAGAAASGNVPDDVSLPDRPGR